MSSDQTFVDDVEVTVEVKHANLPPSLSFSFPGLEDPVHLWHELAALGWKIPARPPHPDPEINWNKKDGEQSYEVLPYRVEGFGVDAPSWPTVEVAERGLDTINMLRRHGVDLHVPVSYLAFLRRAQVDALSKPGSAERQLKYSTTKIPTTLFLSKQPWSALVDNRHVNVYETAAAPSQPNLYWAESQLPADELFTTADDRANLLRSFGSGWELISRMEAPKAVDGRDRILRFVVDDLHSGTAMLDQLKESVGDSCASLLMRPINETDAVANCLLLVAVVPKELFAKLGESMISNYSDAVARGRRYVPNTDS